MSREKRLTPGQRLVMRIHLFICPPCARHRAQLLYLFEIFRMVRSHPDEKLRFLRLPDNAREKILQSVRDKAG